MLSLLDYNIIALSPLLYHLIFIVGLKEDVSSSMVSELRSCVQLPLAMQFFATCISPSLASVELTVMTTSE
jgi:hypothetical protein